MRRVVVTVLVLATLGVIGWALLSGEGLAATWAAVLGLFSVATAQRVGSTPAARRAAEEEARSVAAARAKAAEAHAAVDARAGAEKAEDPVDWANRRFRDRSPP